jgi:hypothetical protein
MAIVGMRIKVALSTMIQIKPFHCHLICKCFLFFPAGLGPQLRIDRAGLQPKTSAVCGGAVSQVSGAFAQNNSASGTHTDALQSPNENLQAWTRGRDFDLRRGASICWVLSLHWRRPGMTFIWTQVLSTSPPTFMHHIFAL